MKRLLFLLALSFFPGCYILDGYVVYDSGYHQDYSYRHVHGAGCGHYYWGSDWHSSPRPERYRYRRRSYRHVHGTGCGHYYWDSVWHSSPRPESHRYRRRTYRHVHGTGCGHYYWGRAWHPSPQPNNRYRQRIYHR